MPATIESLNFFEYKSETYLGNNVIIRIEKDISGCLFTPSFQSD